MATENKLTIAEAFASICKRLNGLEDRVHVAREHQLHQGRGIPPGCHLHDFWELKVALQGRFLFETPDHREHIPEGHILLIPPNTVHVEYRNGSELMEKGCAYLYMAHRTHNKCEVGIQFRDHFIFHALTEEEWMLFKGMIAFTPSVIFERIVPSNRYAANLQLYQLCLMRLILSSLHYILSREVTQELNATELALHRTVGYLETRFHQHDISLRSVAKEIGVSSTYLNKIYKEQYGKSIWQTIIDLRLEKAGQLLKQKKYSVKEVASLAGWASPFYFSKVFRERLGIPPSKF